jgi:hypothetical protein
MPESIAAFKNPGRMRRRKFIASRTARGLDLESRWWQITVVDSRNDYCRDHSKVNPVSAEICRQAEKSYEAAAITKHRISTGRVALCPAQVRL